VQEERRAENAAEGTVGEVEKLTAKEEKECDVSCMI